MKLLRYIAVNALIFFATSIYACSWFPSHAGNVLLYRIMPLDESDYGHYATSWESDYKLHQVDYKAENLKLWQQQTSSDISISDIEHVVYISESSFLKDNKNIMEKTSLKRNSFAMWIVDNNTGRRYVDEDKDGNYVLHKALLECSNQGVRRDAKKVYYNVTELFID